MTTFFSLTALQYNQYTCPLRFKMRLCVERVQQVTFPQTLKFLKFLHVVPRTITQLILYQFLRFVIMRWVLCFISKVKFSKTFFIALSFLKMDFSQPIPLPWKNRENPILLLFPNKYLLKVKSIMIFKISIPFSLHYGSFWCLFMLNSQLYLAFISHLF